MQGLSATGRMPSSIGQLEDSYSSCCKALRILIRDHQPLDKVKRSACWMQLDLLHRALPNQYRDPMEHYLMEQRIVESEQPLAA